MKAGSGKGEGDPIARSWRILSSIDRQVLAALYGHSILFRSRGITLEEVHVHILRRTSRRRAPIERAEVEAVLVGLWRLGLCESIPGARLQVWWMTPLGRRVHVWGKETPRAGGCRRRGTGGGKEAPLGEAPLGEAPLGEESVRRAAMIWMLGTVGLSGSEIGRAIGLSQTRVQQILMGHAREIYARVTLVRIRGPRSGEEAEAALMARLRRAGAILSRVGPVDLARREAERRQFLSDSWWKDERFGVGRVIRDPSAEQSGE